MDRRPIFLYTRMTAILLGTLLLPTFLHAKMDPDTQAEVGNSVFRILKYSQVYRTDISKFLKTENINDIKVASHPFTASVGMGTGFAVAKSDDGKGVFIMTNHHVIDHDPIVPVKRGDDMEVLFYKKRFMSQYADYFLVVRLSPEGRGIEVYAGEVIQSSERYDFALIYIEEADVSILPFTDKELIAGDSVTAIGYPGIAMNRNKTFDFIDKYVARVGKDFDESGILPHRVDLVSAVGDEINDFTPNFQFGDVEKIGLYSPSADSESMKAVFHSAGIDKGNSGGPILNNFGEVVAQSTWGKSTSSGGDQKVSQHVEVITSWLDKYSISYSVGRSVGSSTVLYVVIGFVVVLCVFAAGFFGITLFKVKSENSLQGSNAGPNNKRAAVGKNPAKTNRVRGGTLRLILKDRHSGSAVKQIDVDRAKFDGKGRYLVLGRDSAFSDVEIANSSLSRQHIGIVWSRDGEILIEDRNSTNGTKVRGKSLAPFEAIPLPDLVEFQIGELLGTAQVI